MAYEGSLAKSPFPEVLLNVGRNSETGILTLQGKEEIIGVTFLDGAVVSVDAVNQAPEDGLGVVLAESGLVSREDFSSLVAENQAGGGRVIDLLVERGYLNREQLLEALRQQTLRLCAEACEWHEGQFRFYRGDQVSYEHGIEPINVDDLLGRLAFADATSEPEPEPVPVPGPDPGPVQPAPFRQMDEDDLKPQILRLEDMEPDGIDIEMLDLDEFMSPPAPAASPSPAPDPVPLPVEMPDVELWDEDDEDDEDDLDFDRVPVKRKPWFDLGVNWQAVITPLMPGRLLGIGMLVSLAALIVLAPERFLVPLEGQERIRVAVASEVRSALYSKVDQAAKTFFLLRGAFPEALGRLVDLGLLAASDTRLSRDQSLAYTAAPVSYLLAVDGGERVEDSVRTEAISGNFLLDPDFSPPELVDTPPLVLLD